MDGLDGTRVPNRYANDPRVTAQGPGRGYTVHLSGETFRIRHTEALAWTICYGANLDHLPVAGGGFAIHIDTAGHAIEALLGEPVDAVTA